jgi:hypothetical protein
VEATSVFEKGPAQLPEINIALDSFVLLVHNLDLLGIGPMQTLSGGSVSTPRRQSCDRCHGQKLRCPRPSNGNSGACERCIRSKAQCVYSSSLPKGRPSSYRQNRQNTNAPNVKSSAGSDKATSGGIDFGVDNNVYSAVTETTIVEEQQFDPTTTALWDNPMAIDWMEYIDNTFQESDQWLPESQNVCILRKVM